MGRTSKAKSTAKVKKEEAPKVLEVPQTVEAPKVEEPKKAEQVKKQEPIASKPKVVVQAKKQAPLPPHVEQAMKSYPNLEWLYVNDKGFVFVKGTSANMRGNAKLYRNKYYKK